MISTLAQALILCASLANQAPYEPEVTFTSTAPNTTSYTGTGVVITELTDSGVVVSPVSEVPSDTDRITEDDPRWDCATMGNLICGPSIRHPYIPHAMIDDRGTVYIPAEHLAQYRDGVVSTPDILHCVNPSPCERDRN